MTTSLSGASGGADFEPNAVGFDAQARAGEHRWHTAGKTVSQQDRPAKNLRATPHRRREETVRRAEPGRVRPAGVTGVDRCRDEDPLSVIDADERKLQQPAKALLGAQMPTSAPSRSRPWPENSAYVVIDVGKNGISMEKK
jgi:hypothetical protein